MQAGPLRSAPHTLWAQNRGQRFVRAVWLRRGLPPRVMTLTLTLTRARRARRQLAFALVLEPGRRGAGGAGAGGAGAGGAGAGSDAQEWECRVMLRAAGGAGPRQNQTVPGPGWPPEYPEAALRALDSLAAALFAALGAEPGGGAVAARWGEVSG
jgi:hypothetical protein